MHGVDYYQVLGIPISADSAQIKAKYKVLAKKFHPDLNGDVKKMASINEAYRVLSDPQARHRYNQTLDIPKTTARRHNTSDGYVYTPHAYQRSTSTQSPRSQPSRAQAYATPKRKQSTMGKWAWAATFAVLLGILLGAGFRNPIPNGAASTLGVTSPAATTQQTPSTSQQTPATPSNTLNDTPPVATYTDPTSPDTAQSDTNSATEQACSKYRKYSRNYENCVNRSINCSSDSYYSYLDC